MGSRRRRGGNSAWKYRTPTFKGIQPAQYF